MCHGRANIRKGRSDRHRYRRNSGEPVVCRYIGVEHTERDESLATGPTRATETTRDAERRRGFSVDDQLKPIFPLLVAWAFGFCCLALVAQSSDVGELMLDPTWVGGAAWYAGVVSQLGAVAWTAAAVSALFGAWMARVGRRWEASRFLMVGAFATSVLLADDLFGFHAALLPQIGVPKPVAQLVIIMPAAFWVIRYRLQIQRTRYSVLVASVVANVMSLAVDRVMGPGRYDFTVLFEDGPKFLGVLAWATYFAMTTRDIARSVVDSITVDLLEPEGESNVAAKSPAFADR